MAFEIPRSAILYTFPTESTFGTVLVVDHVLGDPSTAPLKLYVPLATPEAVVEVNVALMNDPKTGPLSALTIARIFDVK